MSIRSRVIALFSVLALIGASAVLVSAVPASATSVAVTVTSAADSSGTCPSATDCTLRQALADAASGGTNGAHDAEITITEGLGTISLDSTLNYDGGISGAQSLTLNGNGVTIGGNDTFGLLAILTTGITNLNRMGFTGGESGTGGAVAATGEVHVNDSVFANNHSSILGGALYIVGATVISNTSFIENTSDNSSGAVYSGGTATITNATFTNNSASSSGGAVLTLAALTISDTTFSGNTALNQYGGAVITTATVTASNSVFLNNSALSGGGAIGSPLAVTVTDTLFEGNTTSGAGGAIYTDTEVVATNSAFIANQAVAVGAILGDDLTITSSDFSNNSATTDIGAVAGENIVISDSSFTGNSAVRNIGAVDAQETLAVSNSTFSNNTSGGLASAFVSNGPAFLVNSTVANNTSDQITMYVTGNFDIAYSTITNNTVADADGFVIGATTVTMFGTVLEKNDGAAVLCSANATSNGFNYANDTSCGLTSAGDTEGVGIDPKLGVLADNGGPGLTRLPLVGSPLIGAIPNAACTSGSMTTTDQRGFARPDVDGGSCDIGAVQLTPQVSASVTGRTVTMSISEFTATATITMYSDPIVLGTIAIDAVGSGTGTFDVDCSVQGGTHTITATATGGQTASTTIELEACAVPAFTG
jgi:predicted outer membrane repeat protein